MSRLTVLILASLPLCPAQQSPIVTMDSVMTVQEMRETGVGALNSARRAVLDKWLTEYTLKIIQIAQPRTPTAGTSNSSQIHPGTAGGHWIKSTASNGALVTLEDGSLWDINSIDRIDTMLWATGNRHHGAEGTFVGGRLQVPTPKHRRR